MNLSFLPDESAPGPIVKALRAAGFSVSEPLLGLDDVSVLRAAYSAGALVLTRDKDFQKLVLHDRHPCHGVVLIKFVDPGSWTSRSVQIVSVLQGLGPNLRGKITVIDSNHVSQTPIP